MANTVKIEYTNMYDILHKLGIFVEPIDEALQRPLGPQSYRAKVHVTGPDALVKLEVIEPCDDFTFTLGADHTLVEALHFAAKAAGFDAYPSVIYD
jgi:hypothetical protein